MKRQWLIEERLTHSIIGAFFDVYNTLGFGFLEHLYVTALERELLSRGHHVAREVSVHVTYKGENLGTQRLDMVVDQKVVIEVKSTFDLHRSAERQLYNYLRATNLEVGFLFYFGPKAQFYRVVCRNKHASSPRHDLEQEHLLPLERPDGDVALDPSA
ncbi:MAG: GxxExxY protein [Gemmatimonadota bacterium]|nr:GxxExxY protein [Gemmatimonadota bacterium]